MTIEFRGIFTPVITPIGPTEAPDLESLGRLVDWQIGMGVHGIWALGTTSEFASFDQDERAVILNATIAAAQGRVPIIANISDASTRLAIRHGLRAMEAGADAVAATPPYYYPHSADELLTHYRTIRDAVDLPLFIYNIPQMVKVKVEQTTARTLAEEGTVAGIKDSQNDLEWFRELTSFTQRKQIPFAAFSGTRPLIDAAVICGATGAIPNMANAFPDLCEAAFQLAEAGDFVASSNVERQIIEIEALALTVRQGSRNAKTTGLQKAVLHDRGIIANPALTRPLYSPSTEERAALLEGVARLQASAQTV